MLATVQQLILKYSIISFIHFAVLGLEPVTLLVLQGVEPPELCPSVYGMPFTNTFFFKSQSHH